MFYDQHGEGLFLKVREFIQTGDKARGDLLAAMAKKMTECKQIAIECASKLAPYQSPKLESIEVNKKVTHRYVIEAPKQFKDSGTWLNSINKPLLKAPKEIIIDHEAN